MTIQSRAYSKKRAQSMNGLHGSEYLSEMNGCAYKTMFPSKRRAQARANKIMDAKMYPYKCKHCHRWHLTRRRYKRSRGEEE